MTHVDPVALEHTIAKIEGAEIDDDPYTHIVVDGVFPDRAYAKLLMNFLGSPSVRDAMVHPRNAHRVYENVKQLDLVPDPGVELAADGAWSLDENLEDGPQKEFWRRFRELYFSDVLVDTLREKFADRLKPEGDAYPVGRLAIDYETAGLGPHVDRTDKLISVLFYLPGEDDPDLREACGTQFLRPTTSELEMDDRHYGWDDFEVVKIAEYRPNRMVAWPVTDDSFHAYYQSADVARFSIKMFVQSESKVDDARERIAETAAESQEWREEDGEAP